MEKLEVVSTPDEYLDGYDSVDDEWISTSMLSSFQMCQVYASMRYLERHPECPKVRQTIGICTHKGRQLNLEQKVESHEDLPVSDITDKVRDEVNKTFDNAEVRPETEFEGKGISQVRGIAVDMSVEVAEKDREVFHPEIQPIAAEESMAFRYTGLSHTIVGKIDVREEGGVISDLKTGKRAFGQTKTDDSQPLTVYSMLEYSRSGQLPTALRIHNLVASGKTPCKHNTYTTTRSMEDIEAQLRVFAQWLKVIKAGLFAPQSTEHWFCSADWCSYHHVCPYSRRK